MDFESFARLNFRDVASRRWFPLRFSFTEQPLKTLYTPKCFQKLIFSVKTPVIGKCLQLQENASLLNASLFFSSQISLNFKPRALETALSSSSWQEEIAMTPSSQWRFLRFPWNPEVKEPRANTYPQYVRSCSVCFSPLSTISKSHWQIVHISRKTSSSISLPSSKLTISGLLYLRSSQCLQVT